MCGNIIDDTAIQEEIGFEKYDIAVANILAAVIIPLSGEIGQHIKPGGLFISSGIIKYCCRGLLRNHHFQWIYYNRYKHPWKTGIAL